MRRRRRPGHTLALWWLVAACVPSCTGGERAVPPGQTTDVTASDDFPTEAVDEVFQAYVSRDAFMGSVLVARGDAVLFEATYGAAGRASHYAIASLTKAFTALLVVQLVDEGALALTDPVSDYLPAFNREATREITVLELLQHRSGLVDYTKTDEMALFLGGGATSETLVIAIAHAGVSANRGTFEYCNSNYVVLGRLVEVLRGTSLESVLQSNIFDPLGMTDTGVMTMTNVSQVAQGHVFCADRACTTAPVPWGNPSAYQGAGYLYSTPRDLLKWVLALQSGALLNEASRAMLFDTRAPTGQGFDYALGWIVSEQDGRREIWHTGSLPGISTRISFFDDGTTLIFLSNLSDVPISRPPQDGLVAALLAVIFDEAEPELPRPWPSFDLSGESIAEAAGDYAVAGVPGFTLRLIAGVDGLYLGATLPDGGPFEELHLFASGPDAYYLKRPEAQLTLRRDDDGAIVGLDFYQDTEHLQADRTNP